MDYDFGDILDARKAPNPLGHFLLVLGETRKREEVMYYIITSRVYAVFKDVLSFFNDCIQRKDKNFFKYFKKEKEKELINPHGKLVDTIFLDKYNCYDFCLDVDSMIVLNSDPRLIDKKALETLRNDGKVCHKNRLTEMDMYKLITIIKHSPNVSIDKCNQINANFNRIIKGHR